VHTTGKGDLLISQCLRATDGLAACPTGVPRCRAALLAQFQLKFGETREDTGHHAPRGVRRVDAFAKRPQHDSTLGLEASTIKTRFNYVRAVIRAAIGDRFLAHDISAKVTLPRRPKAAEAMAIPTPAEVGKLLRFADDHFTAFVALCGFAGTRLGEAAALRVGDIKFLSKEIRIERQVQRANGRSVEIRPPKYESVRTRLRAR
jgi:integrase